MATVTTPAGEVLEGVEGALLDYYRAEGYQITDDEPEEVSPDADQEPVDSGEQSGAVEVPTVTGAEVSPDADAPHYDA